VDYHDPSFQEPWYLLLPAQARALLTPDQVVDLYRERMQIEQSFRDFKTHLGLRGLRLKVSVEARMGRLLLAFCLAYILCVLFGESPLAQQARGLFEILRHHPRHGATRTLSALSMAMLMLSHGPWACRSLRYLKKLITDAAHHHPWLPPAYYLIPLQRAP